jgi:hypothetical protein
MYGRRSVWIELTENQREWLEERTAILEYDGGVPRHIAEVWCWGMLREGPQPDRSPCGSPTPDD